MHGAIRLQGRQPRTKDHVTMLMILYQVPDPSALQPPYKGSKAMLKIGKTWITSAYGREIHHASRVPPMIEYCKKRHKWNDSMIAVIHQDMKGQVRKNKKWRDFINTMNMMHKWLPLL